MGQGRASAIRPAGCASRNRQGRGGRRSPGRGSAGLRRSAATVFEEEAEVTRRGAGPRGERLADELHRAERDVSRLPIALEALGALTALDRRQVLASFARLHRSA